MAISIYYKYIICRSIFNYISLYICSTNDQLPLNVPISCENSNAFPELFTVSSLFATNSGNVRP